MWNPVPSLPSANLSPLLSSGFLPHQTELFSIYPPDPWEMHISTMPSPTVWQPLQALPVASFLSSLFAWSDRWRMLQSVCWKHFLHLTKEDTLCVPPLFLTVGLSELPSLLLIGGKDKEQKALLSFLGQRENHRIFPMTAEPMISYKGCLGRFERGKEEEPLFCCKGWLLDCKFQVKGLAQIGSSFLVTFPVGCVNLKLSLQIPDNGANSGQQEKCSSNIYMYLFQKSPEIVKC